ncbi:hypothetical protein CO669_26075 [Bradyrhizobium sp. Y36]|nr:hypothetical protein CO669_26075 [Bradyrhizobium sp. Y36]
MPPRFGLPQTRRSELAGKLRPHRVEPCLVCKQTPSDPCHLKFAQPRTLSRKVSDEFTVPLCRKHHQALHRYGDERTWWAGVQMSPLSVAGELWASSPAHVSHSSVQAQDDFSPS